MIKVKLTYFKVSGKYYSEGEFETKNTLHWDIVEEVRKLKGDGKLPGLVDGATEFIIYINPSSDWGNDVPHIIPA